MEEYTKQILFYVDEMLVRQTACRETVRTKMPSALAALVDERRHTDAPSRSTDARSSSGETPPPSMEPP